MLWNNFHFSIIFDRAVAIIIRSNIISSWKDSNKQILPVLWQMFARQRSTRGGEGRGRLKFNQFRSRESDEMVSFRLRNAIFLCPKPMKEKGKLAGGRRRARAVNPFFALSLYGFLCARIRGPPSTHRSVISQERGRNGQVGRYILAYPVVCSVAPYRIFDISLPYPVDTACGKTFDRSGAHLGKRKHVFRVLIHISFFAFRERQPSLITVYIIIIRHFVHFIA